MKNKIIIGVVITAVIATGISLFLFRRGTVVPPGVKISNPGTLAALMAAGGSVKCTVAPGTENDGMSGTFYVSGKNVRGDFSVNDEGQATASHMIVDNQFTYTWFDGNEMGFKMVNTTEPGDTNDAPVAETRGFDPNQAMDYQCVSWIKDASLFIPPTDVTFSEFGAPAEVSTPSISDSVYPGTANQCAACEQLPAEYKAQCLSSLGCK